MSKKLFTSTLILAAFAALLLMPCRAQQPQVYSAGDLEKLSQKLRADAIAKHDTKAVDTLGEFSNHKFMIATRISDGGAEVHGKMWDVFFVVDGEATLITGGAVADPKTDAATGETTGTKVVGGTSMKLTRGAVIHIAPNVPHQLLIPQGSYFTYFVVKVKD